MTEHTPPHACTGNSQLRLKMPGASLQSSCHGSLYGLFPKSEVSVARSKTGGWILARQRGEDDWLSWENFGWVTLSLWARFGTSWEANTKAESLHKGLIFWNVCDITKICQHIINYCSFVLLLDGSKIDFHFPIPSCASPERNFPMKSRNKLDCEVFSLDAVDCEIVPKQFKSNAQWMKCRMVKSCLI